MNSPSTLSKSAFAARHGIARSAVSKWISRGQLTGDALTRNGRVNVAVAERQLRALLDPARSQTAINGSDDDAAGLIAAQRRQRIEEGEIRLRRLRAEENARRGRYTLTSDAERSLNRSLQQLVAAIENWLPDLIVQVGGDAEALAIARKSWRAFRERESAAAEARAKALAEFVSDPGEGEAARPARKPRKGAE
jgi:hypothetical protein